MTTANLLAGVSREMDRGDPMEFAMAQAISWKNQFGSDVDMVPNASVTLSIEECALKKAAAECGKEGGPIKKEKQCNNCLPGLIAKKLGMNLKAEFTDKGCEMVIGK